MLLNQDIKNIYIIINLFREISEYIQYRFKDMKLYFQDDGWYVKLSFQDNIEH